MPELPFFNSPNKWNTAKNWIVKNDPTFKSVVQKTGRQKITLKKKRSPFEYLLRAIIFQQITGNAAQPIHDNLLSLFPYKRPNPKYILKLSYEKLRSAGVSKNKALAIKDLSKFQLEGMVPGFSELSHWEDEEIIEQLTAIRGIGRWTVQMLLIFQLGRPDILPATDLGVRKGATLILGKKRDITIRELENRAQHWAPYRSIASWYCWRATEL